MKDETIFEPADKTKLREWFDEHSTKKSSVWIVIYKKSGGQQLVSVNDIVEEAICHGWIDSKVKAVDEKRYALFFTPRKSGSHWTEGNKQLAEKMIIDGRMTTHGMDVFASDR